MKSKSKRINAAIALLTAVVLVVLSGCDLFESSSGRPERNHGSDSNSNSDNTSIAIEPPIEGDSMFVTGVEENISLKESDEDNGKVLKKLNVGEEVQFISDDSPTSYYVSYNDILGYIKKEYLTKEENAACKREDAYIARNTSLNDIDGKEITEIQSVNKNDKIFIVSKNSGGYWFIYHKSSKTFGFVNTTDIVYELESKAESSKPASNPTPNPNPQYIDPIEMGYPVGKYPPPAGIVPYEVYYVSGVKEYLALRSAKNYNSSNEIGKMKEKESVYVIDKTTGTYWYCYSPTLGMYGYADSRYMSKNKPKDDEFYIGPGSAPTSGYTTYYVSGVKNYLALRSAKSSDSLNEIGQMKEAESVYVINSTTGTYWYCYSPTLGKYGFADSRYMSKTKPVINKYYIGSGSAPTSGYTTYYVSGVTQFLGIRSAQSFDASNIIAQAYEGEEIYVVDKNTGSKYWYCYYVKGGVYGFADSGYLSTSKPAAPAPDPDPVSTSSGDYTVYTVTGTASYLGVRSQPVFDESNIIAKLNNGEQVYVYSTATYGSDGNYWQVYSPTYGVTGYANYNYLTK